MMLALPVIRLQVQTDRIKPGLPPLRRYGPEVLREVAALRIGTEGVIGVAADGTEIVDVHHVQHPRSRNVKGRNGISVMTTGDYAALRERYGGHVVDGIAAESILVDYAPGLADRAMPSELVAVSGPATSGAAQTVIPGASPGSGSDGYDAPADAAVTLTGVHVAKPCVEFTRFCLRLDPPAAGDDVRQGLNDLDHGARGYKMTTSRAGLIRRGDVIECELAE